MLDVLLKMDLLKIGKPCKIKIIKYFVMNIKNKNSKKKDQKKIILLKRIKINKLIMYLKFKINKLKMKAFKKIHNKISIILF
jgi:hypothetical protein